MKKILGALIFCLLYLCLLALGAGHAKAAVCGPYPFVFVNGQVANAVQVNADFNWVNTCLNNTNVNTFAALRANTAAPPSIIVAGGTFPADGSGGLFIYNPLDTTSPDNGSTIIVDAVGHRWYRSGGAASYVANTVANLASLPIAGFPSGIAVLVLGYTSAGDMPPAVYTLSKAACSLNTGGGDGGSQIPSTTPNNCWLIGAQTVYDVRNWGAKTDVIALQKATTNVQTTSGSPTVVISGSQPAFTSADAGKRIVISDEVTGAANGTTYWGTIQSVTGSVSPFTVTVTPNLAFTTNQGQDVFYGTDDTVLGATGVAAVSPYSAYDAFLKSYATNSTAQPIMTSGGHRMGVCSHQAVVDASVHFIAWNATALCADGGFVLTTATDCTGTNVCRYNNGMTNISGFFVSMDGATFDGAFLPINVVSVTGNGTNKWNNFRVNNWLGTGATLGVTNASTNSIGSATGTITGCTQIGGAGNPWQCTMTLTASLSGKVQPGNLVTGTSVPNGTYVSKFGTGINGLGTYTLVNALSDPTVGSETLTFIGKEITVTGGTTDLVGLVSRGNVSAGMQNRAMVVGFTGGKITMNKTPVQAFSGQSLTFGADANGLVLSSTAGIQVTTATVQQSDFFNFAGSNTGQMPGNQYGCSILSDAHGGSSFGDTNPFYGIAQICLGPDAGSNEFRHIASVNNYGGTCCEFDAPSVVVMDGADNWLFDDFAPDGMIQAFWITGGVGGPTATLNNLRPFANTGQVLSAPANIATFYTAVTGTGNGRVVFPQSGHNYQSTALKPQPLGFFASTAGTWTTFTDYQYAQIQKAANPIIPDTSAPVLTPAGQDFALGPLGHPEHLRPLLSGATYTFQDSDCGTDIQDITPAAALTVPSTLGAGLAGNPSTSCEIHFITGAAGITAVAGSSAHLFNGGSEVVSPSTVSVTANKRWTLFCGTTAGSCYLDPG